MALTGTNAALTYKPNFDVCAFNVMLTSRTRRGLSSRFFASGSETSSSLMAFALYELAANPEMFQKVRSEVDEALLKRKELDYDSVHELKYLESVICEALRLHPPGLHLFRACTKPFTFPSPRGQGTGEDVDIEVDIPVIIPLYGLHTDPKYFEDPYTFNPYLPFGDGPRNCYGQRFGINQSKVALINIVTNFDVTVNRKTITPLEIDPKYLVHHVKGGLWLNFSKRKVI